MKDELVDISVDQSTLKKEQEGVTGRITSEEFTTAFQQWYEC
jgi:hypothetical protein